MFEYKFILFIDYQIFTLSMLIHFYFILVLFSKFGKMYKIRCQHGLIPKPDTITGCGPECTTDYDCNHGHGHDFVCQNHFCVEKPDPCDPSPCGPGSNCMLDHTGNAICR